MYDLQLVSIIVSLVTITEFAISNVGKSVVSNIEKLTTYHPDKFDIQPTGA